MNVKVWITVFRGPAVDDVVSEREGSPTQGIVLNGVHGSFNGAIDWFKKRIVEYPIVNPDRFNMLIENVISRDVISGGWGDIDYQASIDAKLIEIKED